MDIYDPIGEALGLTPMHFNFDKTSHISEPIPAWNKGINHFGSKENHPWYGRNHTEESKDKISKSHKGMKASEETKTKMSAAHMGRESAMGMLGKTHSEETKAKMKQSALNRKSKILT
jgi:hypothetical protein